MRNNLSPQDSVASYISPSGYSDPKMNAYGRNIFSSGQQYDFSLADSNKSANTSHVPTDPHLGSNPGSAGMVSINSSISQRGGVKKVSGKPSSPGATAQTPDEDQYCWNSEDYESANRLRVGAIGEPQTSAPYGPFSGLTATAIRTAQLGKKTLLHLPLRDGVAKIAKSSMLPFNRSQAIRGDKKDIEIPLTEALRLYQMKLRDPKGTGFV